MFWFKAEEYSGERLARDWVVKLTAWVSVVEGSHIPEVFAGERPLYFER